MNTDWFFKIGKTHNICEDYAYADTRTAIAVVSDGCSGSPDTDFGSRLLVRSTVNFYRQHDTFDKIGIIWKADSMATQIGLSHMSLDATLLCASCHLGPDEPYKPAPTIDCRTWVRGDGVVVVRRRDGFITVYNFEYRSGMPNYLSYACSNYSCIHT
jgi:hypothetical protein